MPPFATRPLNSTKSHPIFAQIRRHPFILFGIPFIGIIVGSSFALQAFTQTRYDYQETKVKSVGKEEELGMKSGRRKIDLKEEYYFSMASVSQDDYEPVRVPRPVGVPEWGGGRSGEEAPMKGYRKEDRWV
uniref:Cytochrome c oxidase assembly protein COX16, mitochondrial n=2 Tax=Cryptococcus deneoformans TaxID=40410 RepID=COX16_CRYD1|nr:RecName: Full=Cytochrome c oxidase assembly protein COX16, mitochondrial; Flags: Precursor [Cryptococcus neoformans var. neoformans JEC21]P0CM85.1 RecName: Full=Cytochrome c oxidase assembly protein COX16, mitochondrial; Flags: Precursor [Cryptococcus neoformans var. neoformans B-3501A]